MDEKKYNQLNEVPLANVSDNEVNQIKNLEHELGDKYVIIAFEK